MKNLTTIIIALLPFGLLAQSSTEYLEAKVDTAWNMLDLGHELKGARRIGDELVSIGEAEDNFYAIVNGLQIIGETFYYSPYIDSAAIYYFRAYDIAEKEGDKSEMAYTSTALGSLYLELGRFDEAREKYDKSIEIRRALKDTNDLIFVLIKRGWLFNSADQHDLAMKDYLESMSIARAFRDTISWANSLNGIAIVHKKQENFEQSEKVFEETIALQERIGDQYGEVASKVNLAMLHKSMGKYEEAYNALPPLMEFYSQAGYKEGVMSCYTNMAICSNYLKEYPRAVEEAQKAIELSRELSRKHTEADLYNEIGKAYLGMGEVNLALEYSTRSKTLAEDGLMLEKRRDAEKTLSDIYAELGNTEKALLHYKNFASIKDSILIKEKAKEILRLQTRYETAENLREIQSLKAQAEMDELKRSGLIFGLIAAFLAFAVIINRENKRRKKARALHQSEIKLAESEKTRLQEQLNFKNRELTAQALHIAQKNEMLREIKSELEKIRSAREEGDMNKVLQKISFDKQIDRSWDQFIQSFRSTNPDFIDKLQTSYPNLTKNELRLCTLIKMNLSNKDIAAMLNISDDGVKKARYRLRKKMELDSDENLDAHIRRIGLSMAS